MDAGATTKDPVNQADPGDWVDASDAPVDANNKPLPLVGQTSGGLPLYHGTPVARTYWLEPGNEKENPSAYDANTLKGQGASWGEALKGGVASVKGMFSGSLPGSQGTPVIWNPIEQFQKDWQGVKDWNELRKVNPDYAWGAVLAPMLLTHVLSKVLSPVGMVPKLARGTNVDPEFLEPVVGDLRKAAAGTTGRSLTNPLGKPETVGDFVKVAGKAEDGLNNEFSSALGNHALVQSNLPNVNGQFPIAEAIRKLKDKIPTITQADRDARAYIDTAAAEYEKPINLGELDLARKRANARLDAYHLKNDIGQYSAESKNAQIAIDNTVADYVRDNVYPQMDRLSGKPPGYFRDLKMRVRALMNASSQAQDFADKVHKESLIQSGSTPFERVRPGGSISQGGTPRAYLSNLPALIRPPDPEAAAGAAVRRGFSVLERFPSLRQVEPLSLPLSSLLGYLRAHPSNQPDQQSSQPAAQPPAPPPAQSSAQPAAQPAAAPASFQGIQALKREASSKRFTWTAVGRDGHLIGTNDGTTWFDSQTGQKVK